MKITIAVSPYANNTQEAPLLLTFSDGWQAWKWFCEALLQQRGVALSIDDGDNFVMPKYIDWNQESCYWIPTASGKVLAWEKPVEKPLVITTYVKKLLQNSTNR